MNLPGHSGIHLAHIYEYIGDYPGEMPHGQAKNSNQPYKRVTLAQKTTIADGLKHGLKPSKICFLHKLL